MLMRIEEALSRTAIFSELDGSDIRAIARHSTPMELVEGDQVFAEGEAADAMYVVVSGSVEIWRDGPIATLVEGDTFGELEFFARGKRNARALSPGAATLLRFPSRGETVEEVNEAEPELAADMLHAFLRFLSSRVRTALKVAKDNSAVVRELTRQVYGDRLTGLWNKIWLEERFPRIVEERGGKAALLLLKPDNFKEINDTFGHEAGDETLKLMAEELARLSEGRGEALRYMGNEIGVVLPGGGPDGASREAERLRDAYTRLDLSSVTGGKPFALTVSVGYGSFPEHAADPGALILAVHELPLKGRARGGNTVLAVGEA
jgi:diguanylate cyclase (GGDEF)-like protein